MIEHIVTAINKHTIALYKQKNFSQNTFKIGRRGEKGLGWNFNMFVDACHSGSALTEAKKWALKYSGKCKPWDDEDTSKVFMVNYFNEKVHLELEILTSASESEFALDAGEGQGGRWNGPIITSARVNNLHLVTMEK